MYLFIFLLCTYHLFNKVALIWPLASSCLPQSTLEDYESIPVNQFGLAMLRGMGWKPDEGIGKNKK